MHRYVGLPLILALVAPTQAQPTARDRNGDPLPAGAVIRLGSVRALKPGSVNALAFAPDGKTVATAGADRTIRFWDPLTGQELRRCKEGGDIEVGAGNLTWFPDGKTLAAIREPGELCLWDPETTRLRSRFSLRDGEEPPMVRAFSSDGTTLATAHLDTFIRIWDPKTGTLLRRLGDQASGRRMLALSGDGKTIAWGGHIQLYLRDAGSGKDLHRLSEREDNPLTPAAFSPDGSLLGAIGAKAICLWDVRTGTKMPQADLPLPWEEQPTPGRVAFSADGRLLAAASSREAIVWEILTRTVLARFTGHSGQINAIAFNPDSKILGSAGSEGTVLIWDLTGRLAEGRLRPAALAPRELDAHWDALFAHDAAQAQRALWTLAACPQTLDFFRKRLGPIPPLDAGRVKKLIAALDDESFAVREESTRELVALGESVAPTLRKGLTVKLSLETHRRMERVLERIRTAASAEHLRAQRAVAVLEGNGSASARGLLETLAEGEPEAPLTRQAKAAILRLQKRATPGR
jgi:WD40 repeat protein